jgi:hypothetical protein
MAKVDCTLFALYLHSICTRFALEKFQSSYTFANSYLSKNSKKIRKKSPGAQNGKNLAPQAKKCEKIRKTGGKQKKK